MQHLPASIRHDHQARREGNQFGQSTPLVTPGLAQNGMQRSHDGHLQLAQHRQNVPSGGTTEYAELMLQTDNIDIADIQEISGAQVRGQILLLNLAAHYFWIFVPVGGVIHCDTQALALRIRTLYGG